MLSNFFQVLTAIGYMFACLSLGVFILKRFEKRNSFICHSALIFLSIAFILGAGIISALWQLIALAGLFKLRFILPILGISAIVGLPHLKLLTTRTISQLKNIWNETRSDTWAWQWIAVISTLLLLLSLFSMTVWAGDAVAFYMAVPKVLANYGRLSLLPSYEGFMSTGLQAEMHTAFFSKAGDPIVSKLFEGFNSMATAIILMGISGAAGLKRRGKWLVLAAYVTSSAVYFMVGNGKTDIIPASLGVAAYYLALTSGPLSLIGIFCGFAGTMKLSYLVTVFPGIAFLVIWQQMKSFQWKESHRVEMFQQIRVIMMKGIKIGGWCLLAALSHFIKNGILLNTPFAPVGLSGIGWLDQDFFGAETTRRLVLTYPLALTWGSYYAQDGNLSPLLLAFFPLAIFLPKPKKWLESPLVAITLAGVIGMGFWLWRFPSVLAPRYYLATLLIFFPVAIRGGEYISSKEIKPRILTFFVTFCTIVILIAVGHNSISTYYRPSFIPKFFGGLTDPCDWDWNGHDGGFCVVQSKINKLAKPGDRVYLASWYRYWLRPDLLQCTNGAADRGIIDFSDPTKMWLGIYERGFQYLMVDGSRPEFDPQKNILPDWVKATRLADNKGTIVAYRLEFTQPPSNAKVAVTCQQQNGFGVWELVNQ